MAIDLTKKPEGATHISPHNGMWIKYLGGGGGHYQFFRDGQWEMGFGCMSNSYLEIAQPNPWTGEGLPPVGTVCEVREVKVVPVNAFENWSKCTIVAHNTGSNEDSQVCTIDDHGDFAIFYPATDGTEFRPIRTAEQIAADERDKQNKMLADDLAGFYGGETKDRDLLLAQYLYGKGFRKVQP